MRRLRALLVALLLLVTAATARAEDAPALKRMQFKGADDVDRVTFDVSEMPEYNVSVENDGRRVVLTFPNLVDKTKIKPGVASRVIRNTTITREVEGNTLRLTFELTRPVEVNAVENAKRLYLDFVKEYERTHGKRVRPGLVAGTYERYDERGKLTAYTVDLDPTRYRLVPVLANGEVLGRDTVKRTASAVRALAAVNGGYFATSGEILGLLRIDGIVVGATYYERSALGLREDGSALIAPVYYDGRVSVGGVTLGVSGVNCERGADCLVLYNAYYNDTTCTNEFGREYVLRDGKVARIVEGGNAAIPKDGMVVSVHGAAKDALEGVKVGDRVTVTEDLGADWADVPSIIGAGPTLVANGAVAVSEEEFPSDITQGRAPRTGVGIMPDGHLLLAVVDGRQSHSVGCTLTEFGELLAKFGATWAVNLDGGGSSEMVVRGRVVNRPSDGKERPVGSVLAVVRR